ncbi:MAG: hypothetical protein HY222_01685 [Thaumarchaeota archaeon]|nr:hypothetical protein [Nitrososphaerota archaeon]MBI3641086.1 hypothetical protein [Nitrososphaerota archaeon]
MKTLQILIITVLMLTIFVSSNTVFAQISPTLGLPHAFFKTDNAVYPIQYNLTNGRLVANLVDLPARELIFRFNATGDGQLTVELPRDIIDSTRDGKDKPYLVSVDDMYSGITKRVKADEIQTTNDSRTLTIDFTKEDNEIGIVGTYFIENNSTAKIHNGYGAWPPLQQYEKGFDAQDIICKEDFQLVIKSEDGSPACVRPQIVQNLVERGWGTYATSNSTQKQFSAILPSQQKRITGLENDTGIVTLGNQIYYFETPNYAETANSYPKKLILFFHDVVFTMVPRFGENSLIDGCERKNYWTDAKFSDGTSELLYIYVDSQPCPVHFPQISFSTHKNPQAGLTFYDGKMKLLVGMQDKVQQNVTNTVITEGQNTASAFTIKSAGGPIFLSPTCPICTPEYFNETTTYTGNVGTIIPGYPVFIKISDPYSMSPRTDQISSSDILPNGTFHYTINVTGKFGVNQYTLNFIYGNQSITETLPVLPP